MFAYNEHIVINLLQRFITICIFASKLNDDEKI